VGDFDENVSVSRVLSVFAVRQNSENYLIMSHCVHSLLLS